MRRSKNKAIISSKRDFRNLELLGSPFVPLLMGERNFPIMIKKWVRRRRTRER
jgi:hypothetical protein